MPLVMNFMSSSHAYCLFPQVVSCMDEAMDLVRQSESFEDCQRLIGSQYGHYAEMVNIRYIGDEFTRIVKFRHGEADGHVRSVRFQVRDGKIC